MMSSRTRYRALLTGMAVAALHLHAQDLSIQQEVIGGVPSITAEHRAPDEAVDADNGDLVDGDATTVELELVTRGIYQCLDRGRTVFVDQDHYQKYDQCKQIRAPHYERVPDEDANRRQGSPCSGALIYQGSTYVFSDKEPCPIPEAVFRNRQPIEAAAEYYIQP